MFSNPNPVKRRRLQSAKIRKNNDQQYEENTYVGNDDKILIESPSKQKISMNNQRQRRLVSAKRRDNKSIQSELKTFEKQHKSIDKGLDANKTSSIGDEWGMGKKQISSLLTRDFKNQKQNMRRNYPVIPQIIIGDFQIYNSYKAAGQSGTNSGSVIKQVNNFMKENYNKNQQPQVKNSLATNESGGQLQAAFSRKSFEGQPNNAHPFSAQQSLLEKKQGFKNSMKKGKSLNKFNQNNEIQIQKQNEKIIILQQRLEQYESMIEDLTNPQNVVIDDIPEEKDEFMDALKKVQSISNANFKMLMRTKQQLHESQKEVTDLKHSIAQLTRKYQAYFTEGSNDTNLMANQMAHINQQKIHIQELETANQELNIINQQRQKDIQMLTKKIGTIEKQHLKTITNMSKQNPDLLYRDNSSEESPDKNNWSIKENEFKKQINEMEMQNERLKLEMKQIKEDNERQTESLMDKMREKESMYEMISIQFKQEKEGIGKQRELDIENLSQQLDYYKTKLQEEMNRIVQFEVKIELEQSQSKIEKSRAEQAEKALEQLKQHYNQTDEALSKQIESYKEQVDVMSSSIDLLKEQKAQIYADYQRIKNLFDEEESSQKIRQKSSQYEQDEIKNKLKQQEILINEKQEQIESNEEKIKYFDKEVNDQYAQNKENQQKINELRQENHMLHQRINEMDLIKMEYNTKIEGQMDQIYDLEGVVEELKEQIEGLQEQVKMMEDMQSVQQQLNAKQIAPAQQPQNLQVKAVLQLDAISEEKQSLKKRNISEMPQSTYVQNQSPLPNNYSNFDIQTDDQTINPSENQVILKESEGLHINRMISGEQTPQLGANILDINKIDRSGDLQYVEMLNSDGQVTENQLVKPDNSYKEIIEKPLGDRSYFAKQISRSISGAELQKLQDESQDDSTPNKHLNREIMIIQQNPDSEIQPPSIEQILAVVIAEIEAGNEQFIQEISSHLMMKSETYIEVTQLERQQSKDSKNSKISSVGTKEKLKSKRGQNQDADLKVCLQNTQEEKQKLEKDLSLAKNMNIQINSQNKQLVDELETISKKLAKTKSQLDEARMENAAIDLHLQVIEDQKGEIITLNQQIDMFKDEKEETTEEIRLLKQNVVKEKQKINDLSLIVEGQDNEIFKIQQLRDENAILREVNQQLESVKQSLKEEKLVTQLQTENIQSLEEQKIQLGEKMKKSIQELEEKCKNTRNELEKINKDQKEEYEERIEKLSEQLQKLKEEHETLTQQHEQLDTKDKQNEQILSDLCQTLQIKEKEGLVQITKDELEQKAALIVLVGSLTQESEEKSAQIQNMEKNINRPSSRQIVSEQSQNTLNIEKKGDEKSSKKQTTDEQDLKELQQSNENLQKDLNQKEQKLTRYENKIKTLKECHQQELKEINEMLEKGQKTITEKEEIINSLQTKFDQMEKELKEKDEKMKQIEQKLEDDKKKKEDQPLIVSEKDQTLKKPTPREQQQSPVSMHNIKNNNDELLKDQEIMINKQKQQILQLQSQLKNQTDQLNDYQNQLDTQANQLRQIQKKKDQARDNRISKEEEKAQEISQHKEALTKYQTLFHQKSNKRVNYTVVYQILSRYADAEVASNMEDTNLNQQMEQQQSNTGKKKNMTKDEMLFKIKDFLISDGNLKIVFEKFGKIHDNQDEWQLQEAFINQYRLNNKYIKMLPLIDDLFKNLK